MTRFRLSRERFAWLSRAGWKTFDCGWSTFDAVETSWTSAAAAVRLSCRDDKKLLKHFCAPILISELNCALKQDQSSSLIILSISAEHNFPSILPSSSISELLQSIAQSNENEQQEGKNEEKKHHVMSQLRAEMKSRDRCSFNFLFQFQLLSLSCRCLTWIRWLVSFWLPLKTADSTPPPPILSTMEVGKFALISEFFLHVSISLASTDDNLTRIPPSKIDSIVCSGRQQITSSARTWRAQSSRTRAKPFQLKPTN